MTAFFEYVYEITKNTNSECLVAYVSDAVDYELLVEFLRMSRTFPFSTVNPSPVNVSVPIYSREKNKFVDSMHFSACVEAVLLALVCRMLYNSKKMRCTAYRLEKSQLR